MSELVTPGALLFILFLFGMGTVALAAYVSVGLVQLLRDRWADRPRS